MERISRDISAWRGETKKRPERKRERDRAKISGSHVPMRGGPMAAIAGHCNKQRGKSAGIAKRRRKSGYEERRGGRSGPREKAERERKVKRSGTASKKLASASAPSARVKGHTLQREKDSRVGWECNGASEGSDRRGREPPKNHGTVLKKGKK